MLSLPLSILAAATSPATTQAAQTPGWLEIVKSPMTVVMLCIIVFYIFMIKNKKSQESSRKSMLDQLKRGDRIQTIGGILGTVIEAKEDEVLVKVDESSNTKIRFARSAIHRVLESPKT
jgi:preprotein translocase subunit YajC